MLEQGAILVRPPDPAGAQAILDGDSGAPLGRARPALAARSWWPWRAAVVEVREEEDEPLVFTLRRRGVLVPRCEVRDADGRPIGRVLRVALLDGYGRRVAVRRRDGGGVCSWHAPGGEVLAVVSPRPNGQRLAFAPAAERDPFLRMLLLASTLCI